MKKYKLFCSVLLALTLLGNVYSQSVSQGNNNKPCSFDEIHYNKVNNAKVGDQTLSLDSDVQNWIATHPNSSGQYRIPVVVHVLYTSWSNVSYAQIQAQINALNVAFSKKYAVYNGQTPGTRAVDTKISFCLATQPKGSSWTNSGECGVMRYNIPASNPNQALILDPPSDNAAGTFDAAMNAIKAITHPTAGYFPFTEYLNIWIVRNINGSSSPGVVGFAFMPNPANIIDGVVMRGDCFGDNTVCTNTFQLFTDLPEGKILAHEVGHFFGLYHTFDPFPSVAGACVGTTVGTCNNQGDRVCDTPPTTCSVAIPCTPANSCFETYNPYNAPTYAGAGVNDQSENFMSYSDDQLVNTFTEGQRHRMEAVLNVTPQRFNLWQSANLTLRGVSASGVVCNCAQLKPNFTVSTNLPCVGTPVTFCTSPSQTAAPSIGTATYSWNFGNGATSVAQNPIYAWPAAGTYTVTLTVTDSYGISSSSTAIVTVAAPTVLFTNPTTTVCVGSRVFVQLKFTGAGPYSGIITDQLGVNYAFNNIAGDHYTFPATVTLTNKKFTVTSFSGGFCNGPTGGSFTFNVVNCCDNLVINSDFEAGNIGYTTQHTLSGDVKSGNYAIGNFAIPNSSGWPQVTGLLNNGQGMFFDGFSTSTTGFPSTNIPASPKHVEVWRQNINFSPGIKYHIEFTTTTNFNQLGGGSGISASATPLMFRVKINNVFLPGTFTVPQSMPINWYKHMQVWSSTLTGNYTVSICQVNLEVTGNDYVTGYDYILDDVIVRPEVFTVKAALDKHICAGGNTNVAASGGGTYTWMPGGMTGSVVNVSPSTTTEYTVTSTAGPTCSSSDVIKVFVHNGPGVVNYINCPRATCSSVISVVNGTNIDQYYWNITGPGVNYTSSVSQGVTGTSNYTMNFSSVIGNFTAASTYTTTFYMYVCGPDPMWQSYTCSVTLIPDGIIPSAANDFNITAPACTDQNTYAASVTSLTPTYCHQLWYADEYNLANTYVTTYGPWIGTSTTFPGMTLKKGYRYVIRHQSDCATDDMRCYYTETNKQLQVTNCGCPTCKTQSGVEMMEDSHISFNVVPNPNSGTFKITSEQPGENMTQVIISDVMGRVVMEKQFTPEEIKNADLNIAGNPSGVYFVKIISGGKFVNKKMILE